MKLHQCPATQTHHQAAVVRYASANQINSSPDKEGGVVHLPPSLQTPVSARGISRSRALVTLVGVLLTKSKQLRAVSRRLRADTKASYPGSQSAPFSLSYRQAAWHGMAYPSVGLPFAWCLRLHDSIGCLDWIVLVEVLMDVDIVWFEDLSVVSSSSSCYCACLLLD